MLLCIIFRTKVSWLRTIVSPDGTKAAFAWTPPNLPGSNLAYPYGGTPETFGTLVPPQWDADAESKILFSSWIDNNILSVTESDGLTAEANCISWKCTL